MLTWQIIGTIAAISAIIGAWAGVWLTLDTVRQCPGGCPDCYVMHRHGISKVRPHELDIVEVQDG